MKKKDFFLFIMIFTLVLMTSGCSDYISLNPKGSKSNPSKEKVSSLKYNSVHKKQLPSPSESTQAFLDQVIAAANKGRTPDAPFSVGKTTIETVENSWGKTQNTNHTQVGLYTNYPAHTTTFGYYRHSAIFDVRSFNKKLNSITLKEVKQKMGKPNQILYFSSKNIHQQILVYSLPNQDQLKWVMTKPTTENSNPTVDHISIYNPEIAKHSLSAQLNQMTLGEKIGQMIMVGIQGTTPELDAKTMINQEHVGGIILYGENIKSPSQAVNFTNQLKTMNSKAGNPLPLFISVDEEGGLVERMPPPIIKMPSNYSVGQINKPHLSYNIGQTLGKEIKSLGFNMDYAPVLDVIAHPGKSAIGSRSFSSNPQIVSQLGVSTMTGIQSQGVISVIKHFPGYGSVDIDAHENLPTISYGLSKLEKVDWIPYQNAIKHHADIVRVTHLMVPHLKTKAPASMSQVIITDMLRKKLGFHGVIITDDMTMGAIMKHYSIQTATVKAVQAGANIVMVAYNENLQKAVIHALKQAVKNGTISENRIDDSVYKIMELKQKYKLSNQSIKPPDITNLNNQIRRVTSQLK